ncbi:integrase core domain-containing protein [Microvirga sp. W0021]|uniref:Integrase core domain-containing protein n=1 Tax=Hohaiivirga grylli TaxID=3133970 RepID=A0ABV0BLL6_9HYPH
MRRNPWTLLGHLFLTIGKYGKPKAVRTDNGSVFTSKLFQLVMSLSGIRHQRTEIGCPWQNGRIERLFGTLKQKLNLIDVATPEALNMALRQFQFWYNTIRPHQNLDGLTPHEAWHGINIYNQRSQPIIWFSAWEGLLTGFVHRR